MAAARDLIEAGADVNAKDSFNGTGLIRAAERGHGTIVKRLLETGIDVDHVNRLGWTALLEAVVLGEGGRRTSGPSDSSSLPAPMSALPTRAASPRSSTRDGGGSPRSSAYSAQIPSPDG